MISESIIQQLKKTDISVDAEKTKQRTKEVWSSASKDNQNSILALAGLAKPTVQRAYKTGSISAKLVFAIAQTMNLNPHFLTGESDEPGECSDDVLKELLQRYKYDSLLKQHEKEERKQRRASKPAAAESDTSSGTETEGETEARFDDFVKETLNDEAQKIIGSPDEPQAPILIDPKTQALIDKLTEEDMILLMKSILLRAQAGGPNEVLAARLKMLLIS